jgi:hypothetical protein
MKEEGTMTLWMDTPEGRLEHGRLIEEDEIITGTAAGEDPGEFLICPTNPAYHGMVYIVAEDRQFGTTDLSCGCWFGR